MMSESQAGKLWQPYYESRELSWCIPAQVDGEYIRRHTRSEWIQMLLRATDVHPSPESKVLEAGCGTGLDSLCLATLGFRVLAFDYNEGALKFARQLEGKAREIDPNLVVQFKQDNLLDIHSDANCFDLVFNQAVMEYFQDEMERKMAMSEMVRVTKPGGWVAIIIQHTGHPFNSFWKSLGWEGYTNQPPVRICTPNGLAQELIDAGLTHVSVDGIYPWKALIFWPRWFTVSRWTSELVYLFWRFLERCVPLPRFLRGRLALQIIAVGQKQ
jgi:SAM-dependent methyltransferase